MKRTIVFFLFFASQINFGQNIFPDNGNVGLGTSTPTQKLDVLGYTRSTSGFVGNNGLKLFADNSSTSEGIFLATSNNVGIGTTNPQEKLHLLGRIKFAVNQSANDNGYYGLLESFHSSNTGVLSFVGAGGGGKVIGGENYGTETVIYSGISEKMRVKGNGNFLVGTTTDTGQKLQVGGDISTTGFGRIGFTTNDSFSAYGGIVAHYGLTHLGNANPDILSGYFGLGLFTTGAERVRIDSNGNVGIGTTSANAKLDVNGVIRYGNGVTSIGALSYGANIITLEALSTNTSIGLLPSGTGNLGVGTTNPDSKLTVKGKIHAEEVKIDLAVPADYVFEKYYLGKSSLKPDYTLLTLAEVEKFIEENHHLPSVPSAKEIKENGLMVGEMSNVLLQKIEELTLYSIEQQKTIEKLEKENESIKSILERLSKIEEKLK